MTQLGTEAHPLTVAVVGAGPSGFYAAEALLKSGLAVRINILEKLPAPFGLVRYGVAPDHPKLKTVSLVFHKIAQNPGVHYFGNIELGRDVTLEDLKATHHAIVFCNGAETDRQLGLSGEDLLGSHTATEFVAWYNGHPDYSNHEFDLSQEVAVIIGQGNVAADVCRILAKPVDELSKTDIAKHALDQLAESKVRDVHVIGRRGPAQAKFTSKELRELGDLTDCSTRVCERTFKLDPADHEELVDKTNQNAAKCVEHFRNFSPQTHARASRNVTFHFLLSPREIIGDTRVEKIVFDRNCLVGDAFSRTAEPTGETMELDCGLCFRSIGYRGTPLAGVPFDDRRGVFPNAKGRVLDDSGAPAKQLYASGWIKRGPSGIIGTNRADSVETIATLLQDFENSIPQSEISIDAFAVLLEAKKIKAINYHQWQMIDAFETRRGQMVGKPREKITSVQKMLAIAG